MSHLQSLRHDSSKVIEQIFLFCSNFGAKKIQKKWSIRLLQESANHNEEELSTEEIVELVLAILISLFILVSCCVHCLGENDDN